MYAETACNGLKERVILLQTNNMLTAKNLLYKALDYGTFWNSSRKIKQSPPAKAREQQLNALFKAFQISRANGLKHEEAPVGPDRVITRSYYLQSGNKEPLERQDYIKRLSDIEYFATGEFLNDRDQSKYEDTINPILTALRTIGPEPMAVSERQPMNLVYIFHTLYTHRQILFSSCESDFLQMRYPAARMVEELYCQRIKHNNAQAIREGCAEIDDILCHLIDPDHRSFTEAEIQFPVWDLQALDLNWYQQEYSIIK